MRCNKLNTFAVGQVLNVRDETLHRGRDMRVLAETLLDLMVQLVLDFQHLVCAQDQILQTLLYLAT